MQHPPRPRTKPIPPPSDAEAAQDWLPVGAVVLAAFALILLTTVGLNAQEAAPGPPPADAALIAQEQAREQPPVENVNAAAAAAPPINLNDPAFREAALRQHRERLAAMLQERREERAGEIQAEQAAAAASPAGQAQPQAEQASVRRGSAELLSEPLNVSCHVGERFFTSVVLNNQGGARVDRVKLRLDYDPALLRPVRVSDATLRPLLAGEGRLNSDLRGGQIAYEASLEAPYDGRGMEMLTVEWETLAPIPRTEIAMRAGPQGGNELLSGDRDVLGKADDPADGTLGTQVSVRPLGDDRLRGALLIDNPASLREVQGVDPHGGVTLSLAGPVEPLRAGDLFAVDVRLANPEETPVDDVRFTLRYDPAVLEILDAAPSEHRRPGDNWIVGGVNLHDAPFQRDYPFDFHLANEADNRRGVAVYAMGLSRARALPGGTLARVYLRALASTGQTPLEFVFDGGTATAVRCLGIDVLGALEEPNDGAEGLRLAIAPALDDAATVLPAAGP